MPPSVDAALQWDNGKTYFFKGGNYWRFNDRRFEVDAGFPRNAGEWWFGCPKLRPLVAEGAQTAAAEAEYAYVDLDQEYFNNAGNEDLDVDSS